MLVTVFILTFTIYSVDDNHLWERGTVTASTCEVARQYIIDGLKTHQRVLFDHCRESNQ